METHYPENIPETVTDPRFESSDDRAEALVEDRTLSVGSPSKPLLGVLPVSRLVPQDIHSILDYGNAATVGSGAFLTSCPQARIASIALAAADLGVSAMTDYRLSVAKVIPIEAHETIDYLWGAACIAAPFVLGYWKRAPGVALTHVIAGATNILLSLFTDYRAYKRR